MQCKEYRGSHLKSLIYIGIGCLDIVERMDVKYKPVIILKEKN